MKLTIGVATCPVFFVYQYRKYILFGSQYIHEPPTTEIVAIYFFSQIARQSIRSVAMIFQKTLETILCILPYEY